MTLIISPVVTRLKSPTVAGGARAVDGVAAMQDALNGLKGQFEIFVMRTNDRAGPSTSATGVTRQPGSVAFDVVCAFSMAHLRGTPDLIDTATDAVIARLQGWLHPAGDDPTEYRSARVLLSDFQRGLLLWALTFDFTRTFEA